MSDAFPITFYHRPQCSTSRQVLAMVEAAGYAPQVIDYAQAGWTKPLLKALMKAMGLKARDLLRVAGTPAEELGLLAAGVSEAQLITAMVKHPILVNRPIVVTPLGAVLARPVERVYEVLPAEKARRSV